MKIRYILLLILAVGLAVYLGRGGLQSPKPLEPETPVVSMVPQPEAPEAIAEADMEDVSPEAAEKD